MVRIVNSNNVTKVTKFLLEKFKLNMNVENLVYFFFGFLIFNHISTKLTDRDISQKSDVNSERVLQREIFIIPRECFSLSNNDIKKIIEIANLNNTNDKLVHLVKHIAEMVDKTQKRYMLMMSERKLVRDWVKINCENAEYIITVVNLSTVIMSIIINSLVFVFSTDDETFKNKILTPLKIVSAIHQTLLLLFILNWLFFNLIYDLNMNFSNNCTLS